MIDCQYRSSRFAEYAKCSASTETVHESLCRECLKENSGVPDPQNPSLHLSYAIYTAFAEGKHGDAPRAEIARLKILRQQFSVSGQDFDEWRKTALIPPLALPPPGTTQCSSLGRPIGRIHGCGCWRKTVHECDAQNGLHVIPEQHCPCPQNLYDPE